MRINSRYAFLAGLLSCATVFAEPPTTPREPLAPMPFAPLPEGIEVQFSSEDSDIVARVTEYIGMAKKEIFISQYAISDTRVIQALCAAFQKGVVIGVLLDKNPAIKNYDTPRYLRAQGLPVILATRGLSGSGWHNQRYVIIDRECVVITSCDLTNASQRNTENMVAMRMPSIASRYYNNWLSEAQRGERMP